MTASEGQHAIILLSGGLDSATTLAMAQHDGYICHALSFSYGQRHEAELSAAQQVAEALHAADHLIIALDPHAFAGSSLTDHTASVPQDRSESEIGAGIPTTYVPARNTIFLSYALGMAEQINACDIFIGVNAIDYSGYPDCRPEFIAAFEAMANLATRAAVEGQHITIHAPLMSMTKAEIIQRGSALGVDYGLTLSCYDPVQRVDQTWLHCGRCDACQLRAAGFNAAGITDPAPVAD